MNAATARVDSSSSLVIQAIVLPRAEWYLERRENRPPQPRPMKETWYGYVKRGRSAHDVSVVPIIGCPGCNTPLYLVHTPEAAARIGMEKPPHQINHLGKVTPDIKCGKCSFHRQVYLDRWNKTKTLYAVAYVRLRTPTMVALRERKLEIEYCHAIDRREAIFHMGFKPGEAKIVDAAPALGFYVTNERTGAMSAD